MRKFLSYIFNIMLPLYNFFYLRKYYLLASVVNAFFLLFVTYYANNSTVFTGENLTLYSILNYFKKNTNEILLKDSVLFINVAYDKDVAEKRIGGLRVGKTDVTNRHNLAELLRNLRKTDYKYIFLDVRFEEGDGTKYDQELFKEILLTDCLVIANHKNIVIANDSILEKAAYSDYYITLFSSNFVRYEYLRKEGETMPLKAYRQLTQHTITHNGLLYKCDGNICLNSLVIKSPIGKVGEFSKNVDFGAWSNASEAMYENINNINNADRLKKLAKNKYVVIGNMVDDKHDTYYGKIPGSVLLFSSFWALKEGEHIVKYGQVIFFLLLYFVITLSLFSSIPILRRLPFIKKSRSKLLHFCMSFLGYSTILLIVNTLLFFLGNVIYSIWIPALFFAVQEAIVKYKNLKI